MLSIWFAFMLRKKLGMKKKNIDAKIFLMIKIFFRAVSHYISECYSAWLEVTCRGGTEFNQAILAMRL